MRIAVLSDPHNFHTQKWAKALSNAGAEVVVMSFEQGEQHEFRTVQLLPPIGLGGRYSYLDYLRGGNVLKEALTSHKIDVLNPLNITPFGVWAMQSGFHPVAACAFGADILEYPPSNVESPAAIGRSWDALSIQSTGIQRWRNRWKQRIFRRKVAHALSCADLITGDNQYLVDCMAAWFHLPPQKMEVLNWGVEPALFEASEAQMEEVRQWCGMRPGQKVVLSPRGAKPIYQADIILEAFAKLLAQGRDDTHFVMLSAGYPSSPEVSNAAELLGKSYPNFKFYDQALPRERIHHLWNLVDIFISAPIYDGYSAALAEGRFIGAIPVVNDIPANRELIEHDKNGWICTPFDAETLATDLTHLLNNSANYKAKFGPPNRNWILNHSLMDANAKRFLDLLESRFFPIRH